MNYFATCFATQSCCLHKKFIGESSNFWSRYSKNFTQTVSHRGSWGFTAKRFNV